MPIREFTGELDQPRVREFSGELDSTTYVQALTDPSGYKPSPGEGVDVAPGWADVFKAVPTFMKEGVRLGAGGAVRALTDVEPTPQLTPPRKFPLQVPEGVEQRKLLPETEPAHREKMEQAPLLGGLRRSGREMTEKARLNLAEATPENLSFWQEATLGAAQSLGISLPAVAASLATRSPAPALATMGAAEFGASYDEALRAGKSQDEALQYAGINAIIEAATEKLPLDTLLKRGTPFFQRMLQLYGQEITQENLATVLQDANEFAMRNPEATMDDWMQGYVAERPERAAQTTASTLIASTIQGGAAHAALRATDGPTPQVREFEGELDQSEDAVREFAGELDSPTEVAMAEPASAQADASGNRGLVVALRGSDGQVVAGQRGQVHAQLLDQLNVQDGAESGYVDRQGKFYTREEAANTPFVVPTRAVESRAPSQSVAMQPGSQYTGLIESGRGGASAAITAQGITAPQPERRAQPIRREDILIPFLRALRVPLYEGRVKGKNRLGFYLPGREAVRVKRKSDLEVAAHEVAHLIDDRVFNGFRKQPNVPSTRPWIKGPNAQTYSNELRELSYDRTKVYEGFAEFVRLWMTQPAHAQAAAPQFTKWWEDFVKTNPLGPILAQTQEGMLQWFAQDPTQRMLSKIGPQPNLNEEALNNPWDENRQDLLDRFHGIFAMEKALAGVDTPIPTGPYETARLSAAAYSIINGAIEFGAPVAQPDGSIRYEGKGLVEIIDQVGDDLENWITYAVAKSANELMGQGRENLFTRAEIDAGLALETPEFRRVFDEWLEYNRRIVDFGVAKGIIGEDQRARWRREWYIPFYRVGTELPRSARAKGVEGNWNGIRALTGGTANLRDVLDNMVQNTSMIISQAIRNEARQKSVDFALQFRGGGRFVTQIPKDSKQVSVDKQQVRRAILKTLGLNPAQVQAGLVPRRLQDSVIALERVFAGQSDWMQFWLFGQAPQGDNVIAVMREGKPHFYEVGDPLFYRAIAAINPAKPSPLKDFLRAARAFGQGTITLTFDFMAANIFRDTIHGYVFSRAGFRPVIDTVRGLSERIRRDPTYRDYLANGGGFSSIYLTDRALRKRVERSLKRFYTRKGINFRNVAYFPHQFMYMVQSIADATEMATRIGEFDRAVAKGLPKRHAAYLAREISTDYAMYGDAQSGAGQALSFLFDSVMFLKAGVNGMDRAYRGFVRDPHRARIAGLTGMLAMASIGLYLMNRGLRCYEDLEDWDKDAHWHVFIPNPGQDCSQWTHFRLPKVWEVGAIASMAERSMGAYLDGLEGEFDAKRYAKQMGKVAADQFKLDYMPYVATPLYEIYALNRQRFLDREIETQAMRERLPFARYSPYTSPVFVDLGEAMRGLPTPIQEALSPARMEALYRGYFNTAGLYGLMLLDETVYSERMPERRSDQYPVLRRFTQTGPKRERHETEFWDLMDEVAKLNNTVNFMVKQERGELAQELAENPDRAYYRALESVRRTLLEMSKESQAIMRSDELTRDEKRQRLDALQVERNSLLRNFMGQIREERRP